MNNDRRWKDYCTGNDLVVLSPDSPTHPSIFTSLSATNARDLTSFATSMVISTSRNSGASTASSVVDTKSAESAPYGITLQDLLVVIPKPFRLAQVVGRLAMLRKQLEENMERTVMSLKDVGSFLADDDNWEDKLPNFDHKTQPIYAKLHRTAAGIIYGSSGGNALKHALSAMKGFDRQTGGIVPSYEIQIIENHEEPGAMQTLWWQLEAYYKLTRCKFASPALQESLERLQVMVNESDLWPASLPRRQYLVKVLSRQLEFLDIQAEERDTVILGYIALVQKFPDNFPDLRNAPNEGMRQGFMIAGREAMESGKMPQPVYHDQLFPFPGRDSVVDQDVDYRSDSMAIDGERRRRHRRARPRWTAGKRV